MGIEAGVPGGGMRQVDMEALLLAAFKCDSFAQLAAWTMPKPKPEASGSGSGAGGGGSASASASASGGGGRGTKRPRSEEGRSVEGGRLKKYAHHGGV